MARLDGSGEESVIVGAILAMAHALGLIVVAEGIETEERMTVLRELG